MSKVDPVEEVIPLHSKSAQAIQTELVQERLDDLLIGGMKLWQRTDQFRFSNDALLLAYFLPIKKGWRYLELGCGTGVIPLLLSHRGCDRIVGVECNPVMADLATRNVVFNQKERQISIMAADYRLLREQQTNGSFDVVFANPPYFAEGSGYLSAQKDFELARHEKETTWDEVVQTARRLTKYRGRFCFVHVAERLTELLSSLEAGGFGAKRLRLVHSYPHKPAIRVLVEAVRGGKTGLVIEPPLYIYESPGQYTKEVLGWYER